jgi:non-specific serine/threonine protein kinase
MFEEYVYPIYNTKDIEAEVIYKPRRILGNYLTYLVVDGESTHSVMLSKGKDKYNIQCDCPSFTQREKCNHSAKVLVSAKNQCAQELNAKAIEEKKLLSLIKKNEEIQSIQKKSSIPIRKPGGKQIFDQNMDEEGMHLPFIIPNSKDVSHYRISNLVPAFRTVARRNKACTKLPSSFNGMLVLHQDRSEKNKVLFLINPQNNIEVTCTCNKCFDKNPCIHALESLAYLIDIGNYNMFLPFCNFDKDKDRLLAEYGLSIKDAEANAFKFYVDYAGNLSISFVPPHFVNLNRLQKIQNIIVAPQRNIKFKVKNETHKIGLLFYLSHSVNANAPVKIEAISIQPGKKEEKFSRVIISKEENIPVISVLENTQFDVLMDFSFLKFKDQIGSGYYTSSYNIFNTQPYDSTRKNYLKYFAAKMEEHWDVLSQWEIVKLILDNDSFAKSNLINIRLSPEPLYADISVTNSERFIHMDAVFLDSDGREVLGVNDQIEIYFGKLVLSDGVLYLNKRNDLTDLLGNMPQGKLLFPNSISDRVVKNVLLPLSQQYGVVLPDNLKLMVREVPMIPAIHLKEFDAKFLQIYPKFCYDELTIDMNDQNEHYFIDGTSTQILMRDFAEEKAFVEYIRSMHSEFKLQNYQPYFIISFDEVMKNQWFLQFSKQMMAENIKLVGFNELKKFKYNASVPKWEMKVTSGIDWFDIHVEASWGDQVLGFKDIRKAIINGQNFVVLGDGSFGMLPEEWLKKYSSLFKFGLDDKSGLKISKKHFNIVEMLFDQISDENIIAEIKEKKEKLLLIENVNTEPVPSSIKAVLRPYQVTGYQWMQVLDEVSWGGCLADDMGLGKTLQAITFLSLIKQKYKNPTSLIICPTSLIYNWENELKKFAPELKYHLFYGLGRTFSDEHFNDYDIVISSYGIVRNDIETLLNFNWEYVILDESQAIKNPDAISTKAVQLLKARNRFILSGTPLQNNTYDIYAQFNFLNPGLLGARDFFKQEFANPIDKEGDKDAGMMLRRLIKPFMLRRTKAEVAPDLPEKTEMVLWCQMEKAQKAIYDEYKDYYRHALMQKIETEGMAKAGVYILEGLLRMRQICDDPRLIKDKDIQPVKGIKILELVREIEENMGEHKMLVFSQFTEMLALIREEMDNKHITYCYLDGSTPATKRQEQVELFQSDPDINVFLISLKAGGVGLNLTAAEYVYIVDPWWNPAVEQQAIDRTHRIGQKNKIFAYKMICKDSVEEKIMMLQEKKLNISKEIVQEDTAFFKSLTREDISFLFS